MDEPLDYDSHDSMKQTDVQYNIILISVSRYYIIEIGLKYFKQFQKSMGIVLTILDIII